MLNSPFCVDEENTDWTDWTDNHRNQQYTPLRVVGAGSQPALFFCKKKIGENPFNLFHQCSKKTSETNDVAKDVW